MNFDRKISGKALCFGLFALISVSKCQIPASGSDLPSLSTVQWGMSRQEVKDRIGRDIEGVGDTALTFQDSFMNSNVHVNLTFGEVDSEEGLRFVEIQFDEKNAEKLRSYLKARYGEKFETEKKEKTNLFFTVNLEALKWLLKSESIIMMVFSHGDEVLGLSLLYKRRER
jgi:hypothetical protein